MVGFVLLSTPFRPPPCFPLTLSPNKENHQQARSAGVGEVHLPEALSRKYPNASREVS